MLAIKPTRRLSLSLFAASYPFGSLSARSQPLIPVPLSFAYFTLFSRNPTSRSQGGSHTHSLACMSIFPAPLHVSPADIVHRPARPEYFTEWLHYSSAQVSSAWNFLRSPVGRKKYACSYTRCVYMWINVCFFQISFARRTEVRAGKLEPCSEILQL